MEEEISNLASKVKIKIKPVEAEVQKNRGQPKQSESARKKERENKKLVNLVALLTNKLLRLYIQ